MRRGNTPGWQPISCAFRSSTCWPTITSCMTRAVAGNFPSRSRNTIRWPGFGPILSANWPDIHGWCCPEQVAIQRFRRTMYIADYLRLGALGELISGYRVVPLGEPAGTPAGISQFAQGEARPGKNPNCWYPVWLNPGFGKTPGAYQPLGPFYNAPASPAHARSRAHDVLILPKWQAVFETVDPGMTAIRDGTAASFLRSSCGCVSGRVAGVALVPGKKHFESGWAWDPAGLSPAPSQGATGGRPCPWGAPPRLRPGLVEQTLSTRSGTGPVRQPGRPSQGCGQPVRTDGRSSAVSLNYWLQLGRKSPKIMEKKGLLLKSECRWNILFMASGCWPMRPIPGLLPSDSTDGIDLRIWLNRMPPGGIANPKLQMRYSIAAQSLMRGGDRY